MIPAVILNSSAHGGQGARRWKKFLSTPMGEPFKRVPTFAGEKDDLGAWIREHYDRGVRDWVAAGGDGTVHWAINSFVENGIQADVRIGAIGIGSSNDFHKPFAGRPGKNSAGFPVRLDFSRARKQDLGRVQSWDEKGVPQKNFCFAINSSLGVTAEANRYFNQPGPGLLFLKRFWTDGAILGAALGTFAAYRNRSLSIRLDEQAQKEVEVTNLGLIKNRYFSGSFRYDEGPSVPSLNDGTLGFFLCAEMNKAEMLRTLISLSKGRFAGLPKTESCRVKEVSIEDPSGRSFCIETDGEVRKASKVRIDVLQEAIQLCP